MCDKLGGGTIADLHEVGLWSLAANILDTDSYLWSPFVDKKIENLFVHYQSGRNSTRELTWLSNQPDGGIRQSCLKCKTEGCSDYFCLAKYMFFCQFPQAPPKLRLRGFCQKTAFDQLYYPLNVNRELIWAGATNSLIRYNHKAYGWEAKISGSEASATSESLLDYLLLGTNTWTVHNDRTCFPGNSRALNASLNACTSSQFNCDDGACIGLLKRCDGFDDCKDVSDEFNCFMLITTAMYNKDVIASGGGAAAGGSPATQLAPAQTTKKQVAVSVTVSDILALNELKGYIRVKVIISLRWVDQRLKYQNLRKLKALNSLSGAEMRAIWLPEIYFLNADLEEDIKTHMAPTVHVQADTENASATAGLAELYNADLYKGEDSMLILKKIIRCSIFIGLNHTVTILCNASSLSVANSSYY